MLNLSCKSVEDNFMLIDLHCHEKTNSPCSNASLSEIAVEAQRKGLDAVCITDHDSLGLRESAHTFSKTIHYPIMVGTEIYTFEGDLIVFGLEHVPTRRPHLLELLELVRSVHGVCFSAHPYRSNQRGLRTLWNTRTDYSQTSGPDSIPFRLAWRNVPSGNGFDNDCLFNYFRFCPQYQC